jgi:hypothetical protein
MVPTKATWPGANCSRATAAKSGAAAAKVCHDTDMLHLPLPRLGSSHYSLFSGWAVLAVNAQSACIIRSEDRRIANSRAGIRMIW